MDDNFVIDPKGTLAMRAFIAVLDFKTRNASQYYKRTDMVRMFRVLIDNFYDTLPYSEKMEELHIEYIKDIRDIDAKGEPSRNQQIWNRTELFLRREKYYADETVFSTGDRKPGLRTVNLGDENVIVR